MQVFDNLRRYSPDSLVPIAGDMSMPGLGVSSSNVKILSDNVSIVFHSDATVKFDEALKSAVAPLSLSLSLSPLSSLL